MKRPSNQRIDSHAQKIFESKCPTNWSIQEPNEDYGIDYYIRVFEDDPIGEATKIFFAVQLKGVKRLKSNKTHVSFSMKTDTLDFYLTKVSEPVFLVVVDTSLNKIYWLFLQKYINETLNIENPNWKGQKTVTLKILKKNNFKDTKIIEECALNASPYCNLLVNGIPDYELEFEVKNILNKPQDKLLQLKKHQSKIYDEETKIAFDLINTENNLKDSKEVFISIYNRTLDDETHVISHIKSIIGLLFYYEWSEESDRPELFKYIDEGLNLSKKHNVPYLEHYFYATQLEKTGHILQSEIPFIIQKTLIAEKNGNFSKIILEFEQSKLEELNNSIIQIYSEFFNNMMKTLKEKEFYVFAELLNMLIRLHLHNISVIYHFTELKELSPAFKQIDKLISILSDVAEYLKDDILKYYVLDNKTLYHYYKQEDICNEIIEEYIELTKNNNHKNYLERAMNLKESIKVPFLNQKEIKPSDEDIVKFYEELFERDGINLDNPNDPIANILKIGLKDMNPERVLKNCIHLEIAFGSYGWPAEIYGLLSAGSKILYCKFKGGIEGLDLDATYYDFKNEYCKDCPNLKHHSKDWKWSEEESQKRSPEFSEFLKNLNKLKI